MTYEKTISFHKKMVITEKRLTELRAIIEKYSDSAKYKAILEDRTTVEYSSFDELLSYDNHGKRKIRTLVVEGRSGYSTTIKLVLAPSERANHETASCSYRLTEKDKETTLLNEIKDFFDKATEYERSDTICEWSSLILILFLAGLLFKKMYPFVANNEIVLLFLVIFIAALIIYKIISCYFWDKIFPDVVFAWGEEEHKYKKLDKIRSNLFWGVIVAFLVGVLINVVFK